MNGYLIRKSPLQFNYLARFFFVVLPIGEIGVFTLFKQTEHAYYMMIIQYLFSVLVEIKAKIQMNVIIFAYSYCIEEFLLKTT